VAAADSADVQHHELAVDRRGRDVPAGELLGIHVVGRNVHVPGVCCAVFDVVVLAFLDDGQHAVGAGDAAPFESLEPPDR